MHVDGREARFRSARDALAAGIGMVHQELSIVARSHRRRERLSRQAADEPARHRRLAPDGARGAASISPASASMSTRRRGIGDLPIGLQQLIEIARVLFSGARIIILDEPTSALSPPEIERLFACCASCATRAPASSSSRISSTTSCASPTRSRSSAMAARSLTAPAADIDQGRQVIEHMIGAGH